MSRSLHTKLTAGLCTLLFVAVSSINLAAATDTGASPAVLVELFTSEGCSNCPPADRLLIELDRQQPVHGATVVVLGEHVDYWDQLGWRDPFSSHQWTERQEQYARQFSLQSSYTPQIVVNGNIQASGNDPHAVLAAIDQSSKQPHLDISIASLERSGDSVHVELSADTSKNTTLYAVLADDSDHSSVTRGENAGHSLDHVAVARSFVRVGKLDKSPLNQKISIPIPPGAPDRHLRLIVFAQDGRTGHIVGVAARAL